MDNKSMEQQHSDILNDSKVKSYNIKLQSHNDRLVNQLLMSLL